MRLVIDLQWEGCLVGEMSPRAGSEHSEMGVTELGLNLSSATHYLGGFGQFPTSL